MKYGLVALCALTMLAGPALADPDKDESGKGRRGDDRGREYNFDRSHDRARGYDRGREYVRDRGHDRGRQSYNMNRDREYKQEFHQGNCKVERKWERDGGYKEETKCKGNR